jgi:two-component system LytT family sensor kinase
MAGEPAQHFETDALRAFADQAGRRKRAYWLLYVVFGLLLGLYLGLNQIIDLRGNPRFAAWKPLTWELSSVVIIFAMIPAVVCLERAFPVDSRPRRRPIAAHALGSVLFSAIHVAGILVLRKLVYAIGGEHYEFDNPLQALYEYQKDLITYVIILVVIFAYRQFQVRRSGELRAAELAAELSQARLKHLTAQIEPHFLFNALMPSPIACTRTWTPPIA